MRQPPLQCSRQKPFILEEHLFIYYLVCHTQNNGMNGTLSVFMEQKRVPTKLVTSKGRRPLLIAPPSAKFTLSRLPRLVFQSIPKNRPTIRPFQAFSLNLPVHRFGRKILTERQGMPIINSHSISVVSCQEALLPFRLLSYIIKAPT